MTTRTGLNIDGDFWQGRRVFLTGHTGFKGSWLAVWLQRLGCNVTGYSLEATTKPNLFETAAVANEMESLFGDIRDREQLARALRLAKPDVVLHLAAQSLVRPSYADPVETFSTNVLGTINVLETIRTCESVRATVIVTSDKCYENREWIWPYRESDALGGRDPYSASKACAEIVTASYRDSFFGRTTNGPAAAIATARAGNVLGGGDWSPERLVPDLIRSIQNAEQLVLRYPDSVRPWQHVLDPLAGYLVLAQTLWKNPELAGAWNFATDTDDAWTVGRLVGRLMSLLDREASWVQAPGPLPHEARALRLDSTKARTLLGWTPRFSIEDTLASTASWYEGFSDGRPARALVDVDLDTYDRLSAA
jgi:CDP-glucose 4,6-dehydratase